ncbi:MAG: LCP family protein, partial [bacterium]|nr:LCP family protein [bacterium]
MVVEPTNLLPTDAAPPGRPPSGGRAFRRIRRTARTVIIVAAVAFAVLAWTTRSSNPNVLVALRESATVRSLLSLLRSPSSVLQGEREDRITALLLGMGGEGHDGPLLTDTILVASIQPSTQEATLISIPRDLLIPLPDGRFEKVNAINAYGEARAGAGATAVREALEHTLGIRIPYYARVDFRGFVGLIDSIGGVTIDVERTLDDPQYPITGQENATWYERFEHLVIPAGRQQFDGNLALKYVRSRHALGVEGSDFARARRQQRLLVAVRDRVLGRGLLANPRGLLALLDTWRDHVRTNLSPPELYRFSHFITAIGGDEVTRVVFSDAPDGELVAGLVGGAYVLRPRDGTFNTIRAIVHQALATGPEAASAAPLTVEIWNGTRVNGLATTTASSLTRDGMVVTAVRNAPSQAIERSIIYRSARVPDDVVAALRQSLRAEVSTAFPAFDRPLNQPLPDLLIVLGASS